MFKIEHFISLFLSIADVSPEPECKINPDCPSNLMCIQSRCQNPCRVNNPCGISQECIVRENSVACICPAGTITSTSGACQPITADVECKSDRDCPYNELCHQGSCADPCLFTTCGYQATCSAVNHQARCTCLQGLRGDPYTACEAESKYQLFLCMI